MRRILDGLLAGLLATLAITAVILALRLWSWDIVPFINPERLLSMALGIDNPAICWSIHFFIGTVIWGWAFAALYPSLPGPPWVRGLVFGTGAWLLAVLLTLPAAGALSFLARAVSVVLVPSLEGAPELREPVRHLTLPLAMLGLHWLYGAVLGATYGALAARRHPSEQACPMPGRSRVVASSRGPRSAQRCSHSSLKGTAPASAPRAAG